MENKILGICGIKRSGKDTIADYLINSQGFKRYSFADPIKRGAMEMFGFTEAQMWGSTEDKETVDSRWGISPRRMLQLMGTELFQFDIQKHLNEGEFNVGRNVWVNRFKLWYKEEEAKQKNLYIEAKIAGIVNHIPTFNVVIADVRFQHEVDAIREIGGEIWRVERPSLVSNDMHSSEKEQESIVANKTFINDGTLEELFNKVKTVLDLNLHGVN